MKKLLTADEVPELMVERLREHGPVRASTYVYAVMAETGLEQSVVRELLRKLVDDGRIGMGWHAELVVL